MWVKPFSHHTFTSFSFVCWVGLLRLIVHFDDEASVDTTVLDQLLHVGQLGQVEHLQDPVGGLGQLGQVVEQEFSQLEGLDLEVLDVELLELFHLVDLEEEVEDVVAEGVGGAHLGGDDVAHLHVAEVVAVAPQEHKQVDVHRALNSQLLQPPEVGSLEVQRHVAPQDLVAHQEAQLPQLGAVLGDVHNLTAVALLVVKLEGQQCQLGPDQLKQRPERKRVEIKLESNLDSVKCSGIDPKNL